MTVFKCIGLVLMAAATVLGVAVAALLVLDWNMFADEAESFASGILDRPVEIGRLDIAPGWTTHIELTDLRVANAEWAEADHLVSASKVAVSLSVWPLLTGNLALPKISIAEPKLSLERDTEGRVNWNLGKVAETAGEVAAPESRDEFPEIGRLDVTDGTVRYRDAVRKLTLQGELSKISARARGRDSIELSLDGTLQDEALSLDFVGGSLNSLRDTDQPFPADFLLKVGNTEIGIEGQVDDPLDLKNMNLDFAVKGKSLADIFPILSIPLPDTPPYRLTGGLARTGEKWQLTNLKGTVGDSDLSGTVSLDQGGEKPFMKGDLKSKRLDFDDLAGLIGAAPDPDETANVDQRKKAQANEKDKRIFPDTPFETERLHAMNMDVSFTGAQVNAENLPIERIAARIQVENGRVLVRPLDVSVAKGRISGELAVNAREKTPSVDADITFEELDLKPFFKKTEFAQEMGGRFSGRFYLIGTGESLDKVMASADGDGWIGIRGGSVSGLLVEAVGLDVAEALSLILVDDARVPLRCGRIDFVASGGLLTAKRAIVDTSDSVLLARGNADLSSERLDFRFEARPKDFSFFDASAPVLMKGRFEDPDISIGSYDALPFPKVGKATDIDCERLLRGEIDHVEIEEGAERSQ